MSGSFLRGISIPNGFLQIYSGAPDSEVTLPKQTRGLLIGTAGTLSVTMEDGTVCSLLPLQAGFIPGKFASIQNAGDAENIWAIW